MSGTMEQREFQERTQEIERLVQRVQAFEDANARATSLDLMRAVMDFHAAVVARMVELMLESGEEGRVLLEKLAGDPLVSGLLVLYGVHPLDLETRVAGAIEKVRPELQSRGGSVELLGISEASVRVRIRADGGGSGSTAEVLQSAVEHAIFEAAPEVLSIDVEGVAAAPTAGFVPLAALQPNAKEKCYEKPAA